MEDQLPGMRFYPTEEELVSFYLHNKLQGTRPDLERVIPVVDIYQFDPWQLPQKAAGEERHRHPEEWFFFTPRQEREARGGRPNRITTSGFWKATGSPGWVYSSNNRVIAEKKTMVFYTGKAPTGTKTKWKMNAFRAIEGEASTSSGANPKLLHEFSLCRVYVKSRNSRAFDRRPIGAMAKDTQIHQPRCDGAGYSHDQNSQIMVEKTLMSSDSSSSGDQIHPTKTGGENTNLEMSDDLDLLWEWEEQFDFP